MCQTALLYFGNPGLTSFLFEGGIELRNFPGVAPTVINKKGLSAICKQKMLKLIYTFSFPF